jgi:hypothetical protein
MIPAPAIRPFLRKSRREFFFGPFSVVFFTVYWFTDIYLMRFMITVQDTSKIAYGLFPYSTEIDMYHKENRNDKSGYNMKQVGKMKAACSENGRRNRLRVKKHPSCYKYHGNKNIHDHQIGKLLERIEFIFPCDGVRRKFLPENPKGIIPELEFQSAYQPFILKLVMFPVIGKQVTTEEDQITGTQNDS